VKLLGSLSVFPTLPARLEKLETLIYNLWWAWNPDAQNLFMLIDGALWDATSHNPVAMMRQVSSQRLDELAQDDAFLARFDAVIAEFEAYMAPASTWFERTWTQQERVQIAYFSAEFGLHESLPIYSGGLGILSGDHCKSASDLGLPFVGVGFLYPQGYFTQKIGRDGTQEAVYEKLDFSAAPVLPARDAAGREVRISVDLPGRQVYARVWRIQVGRIPIFLLDTDVPMNAEADRALAARLYGGDHELRVAQEVVLGIGGVRALRALGIEPTVFHMNEGHSAFLSLERVRELVQEQGLRFFEAQQVVAASSVFTTHTPVPAGNDAFSFDLMSKYFSTFWGQMGLDRTGFMNLARWQTPGGEMFSMTVLALRFAAYANGVSALHGQVARQMWAALWPGLPAEEVPITHITNGVHTGTWLAADLAALYDQFLGKAAWREEPDLPEPWQQVSAIPDELLWQAHWQARTRALDFLRQRVARQRRRQGASPAAIAAAQQLFDPRALILGFARRFATYKRANLIFHDLERIKRILNNQERPVLIIFSGKAHPADEPGKAIIRQIQQLSQQPDFQGKIIFIENYDMNIARHLVQGVDLWLNNPRRPNEASGTSGEKAALNAIPNFSVLDGWWAEGYDGSNGWVIGDEREFDDIRAHDAADAESLYETLEREIIPLFFDVDANGVPVGWVQRMKNAAITCAPRFSMSRQVKDYMMQLYLPASRAGRKLQARDFALARTLAQWKESVYRSWSQVQLTAPHQACLRMQAGQCIDLTATLYPGPLSTDDLRVEIVWGEMDAHGQLRALQVQPMQIGAHEASGGIQYRARLCFETNGKFGYGIRVLPWHPALNNRYEMARVKWA
jgi:starch phosphorylase